MLSFASGVKGVRWDGNDLMAQPLPPWDPHGPYTWGLIATDTFEPIITVPNYPSSFVATRCLKGACPAGCAPLLFLHIGLFGALRFVSGNEADAVVSCRESQSIKRSSCVV